MSLIAKIARNTFYQLLGKIGGTVIGLLTVGIMTRYLGQTGFGYYTTIITFLQFFSVMIDFGLQMTTTQMLAKHEDNQDKIFANIFTLRLLSAIIFLGAAAGLIWFMPYEPIIKVGAGIAAVSFLFVTLQSVLISVFQKNLAMAKVAWAEIWGRGALLIGVIIVASGNFGLLYIIAAVTLGSIVNCGILFINARKYLKIKLAWDKNILQQIWQRSWPLALTVALTLVYFRADTLILSLFRPQNEVGIYGATYKVLEILIQFPYLFLGLVLPLLTKFFLDSRELFAKTFQKSFDFLALITVPMIAATVVLGEKIMIFVAGPEFALSGAVLKVIIFAAGIIYLSALFGYTIVACEMQKKMIKFYLIDALISIPLYLIFIPRYSYWAAAIITILTELFILLSSYYLIRKNLSLKLNFRVFLKSVIASIVMAGLLANLPNIHLLNLVIIGLFVYGLVIYLLKGVEKDLLTTVLKIK